MVQMLPHVASCGGGGGGAGKGGGLINYYLSACFILTSRGDALVEGKA